MTMPDRRLMGGAIAISLAAAALTGCSASSSSPTSSTPAAPSSVTGGAAGTAGRQADPTVAGGGQGKSPTAAPPATVLPSPADGAEGVAIDAPLGAKVTGGTVSAISVTTAKGEPVKGTLQQGGTWRPEGRLALDEKYRVVTEVRLPDGKTQQTKSSFRTVVPDAIAKYSLTPIADTVGVGMPAILTFTKAVESPEDKAAIEKRLRIQSTPATEGSWGWVDDNRLMWRPASYWKPGTKVTVSADLDGLKVGKGTYFTRNDEESFTIGRALIAKVDMQTHQMQVSIDGKPVKEIPVTTGKPGFVTRSGTKIVTEKVGHMTMNSDSVGIPKGSPDSYNIDTEWNMRLTTSGEFLHAAPWSQWAQGKRNVSHGCTNMSLKNAKWLFDNAMVGDVFEYTGSDRSYEDRDGVAIWKYSYDQWKAKSALAGAHS